MTNISNKFLLFDLHKGSVLDRNAEYMHYLGERPDLRAAAIFTETSAQKAGINLSNCLQIPITQDFLDNVQVTEASDPSQKLSIFDTDPNTPLEPYDRIAAMQEDFLILTHKGFYMDEHQPLYPSGVTRLHLDKHMCLDRAHLFSVSQLEEWGVSFITDARHSLSWQDAYGNSNTTVRQTDLFDVYSVIVPVSKEQQEKLKALPAFSIEKRPTGFFMESNHPWAHETLLDTKKEMERVSHMSDSERKIEQIQTELSAYLEVARMLRNVPLTVEDATRLKTNVTEAADRIRELGGIPRATISEPQPHNPTLIDNPQNINDTIHNLGIISGQMVDGTVNNAMDIPNVNTYLNIHQCDRNSLTHDDLLNMKAFLQAALATNVAGYDCQQCHFDLGKDAAHIDMWAQEGAPNGKAIHSSFDNEHIRVIDLWNGPLSYEDRVSISPYTVDTGDGQGFHKEPLFLSSLRTEDFAERIGRNKNNLVANANGFESCSEMKGHQLKETRKLHSKQLVRQVSKNIQALNNQIAGRDENTINMAQLDEKSRIQLGIRDCERDVLTRSDLSTMSNFLNAAADSKVFGYCCFDIGVEGGTIDMRAYERAPSVYTEWKPSHFNVYTKAPTRGNVIHVVAGETNDKHHDAEDLANALASLQEENNALEV